MLDEEIDLDELPDTLERCEECDMISASLSNHVCKGEERGEPDHDKHTESDCRGESETVGIYTNGNCYHELLSDGIPLCRYSTENETYEVTRENGKKRNRYPCLSCINEEIAILKELRADTVGEDCACSDSHCHRCRKFGDENLDCSTREDFGNHSLCDSCVEDLNELIEMCEDIDDRHLRYPEVAYTMIEAEVGKGGTEWECSNCGEVTEFECSNPHHPGTLQCDGCERIMTDPRPSTERMSYSEWEVEQAPEADALRW